MITETRGAITTHLQGWPALAGVAIFGHLPDDVAEVPCIAVGRPSLGPSTEGRLIDLLDSGVWVVGRRLNDADAEPELDALADVVLAAVFARINGIPGGTVAEVRANPEVVAIAGTDHPAYLITLTTSAPRPCGD